MEKIKNNLPFNPKGKIFHWGPVPGNFFYCSIFVDVNSKYFRAKYRENWSETLFLFRNNRMFWINDLLAVQAAGLRVFKKYLMPVKTRKAIYKEWRGHTKKLLQLQRTMVGMDLKNLSDGQLKKLWSQFHKIYISFWVTGSIPELANYGSESYLEEKLKSVLKNRANLANVMEILTTPAHLSFYQEEEIDLFKTKSLEKHQQKYFWLKNSYAGTEILPVRFFSERKSKLPQGLVGAMDRKIKKAVASKEIVRKRYSLSSEIMNIAKAISDGIAWQDERKKYIFITLHYEDVMLREVARRFGYTIKDLRRAWYSEIDKIIGNKDLRRELKKRKDGFGFRFFHSCQELNVKETKNFWKVYETKIDRNIHETKGIVASKGRVVKMRGVVHILLDPKDVEAFKDNEILVAPMTSPEYIFAMKKASAVVTDTGGLTSHAAIVSRELSIPCIVGAKGSTGVFKNNDIVEIDTSSGIVKLIK